MLKELIQSMLQPMKQRICPVKSMDNLLTPVVLIQFFQKKVKSIF